MSRRSTDPPAVNDVPERKGQHFAFEVGDVPGVVADLEAAGVRVSTPATIDGICTQVFCSDPSGNLVEFNQRL